MTDRFAHHLRLDQVRDGERLDLVADEQERTDIAKRLDLPRIERFEAHVCVERTGDVVRANGRLLASLEQSCVVTGDPLAAHIDEPFALIFMPEPAVDGPDEEIELGTADLDVIFHDGSVIDLSGALTDTLALSLDPYPRSAAADAALKEAGVLSEEQASPFAVLASLKKSSES
jgi:uncharacterized metal-binding protein YceD (DUF177 family)